VLKAQLSHEEPMTNLATTRIRCAAVHRVLLLIAECVATDGFVQREESVLDANWDLSCAS
jgi:hypothetical protein